MTLTGRPDLYLITAFPQRRGLAGSFRAPTRAVSSFLFLVCVTGAGRAAPSFGKDHVSESA